MTVRRVDQISDRYVEEYAALDPISAAYMGIDGFEDQLTDYSPEGFEAREELTRRALADATAAIPADEREAVARDAFVERLGLEAELDEAGLSRSKVSVITSGVHAIREVFDLMSTSTEQDWANVDSRLAAIPESLAGYRRTLTEEAARGRVSAARQYREVVVQVRGWTGGNGAGGDLLGDLVAGCDVPALKPNLEQHATDANVALDEFAGFLTDELLPRGRATDGVGREEYRLESRYFLGAEIDLDETYAWGWEELKRIEDDMDVTAGRILRRRRPGRGRGTPGERPLPPDQRP